MKLGEIEALDAPRRASPAPAMPWTRRIAEIFSAYLPMLLMGLLALGTWWLVKNTPQVATARVAAAPRHEPDYTMHRFSVQRFAPDGKLRAQIEGDEVRHYPDTDTLEIDAVHMRAISTGPHVTVATARRALVNGDATEVQLLGGAHVVRETARRRAGHRVSRRVSARLSEHRTRAFALAGDDTSRRHRLPRRHARLQRSGSRRATERSSARPFHAGRHQAGGHAGRQAMNTEARSTKVLR